MTADIYRGWLISPPNWPKPWTATGPDYDASYEGPEDGWVASGGSADAPTLNALLAEINAQIEEAK
jgi:hypothetical protein